MQSTTLPEIPEKGKKRDMRFSKDEEEKIAAALEKKKKGSTDTPSFSKLFRPAIIEKAIKIINGED